MVYMVFTKKLGRGQRCAQGKCQACVVVHDGINEEGQKLHLTGGNECCCVVVMHVYYECIVV